MNKKKLTITSIIGITAFALSAVVLGTVAWFQTTIAIPKVKINGNSAGAYFAYGNGNPVNEEDPLSSDRPYGISHPRHLYNLAWLQYMGFFADGQYYFELADSVPETGLDMDGWILPPIGTEDNPFVGHFDGNEKTIKNLTISNDENTLFDSNNKHPDLNSYIAPKIVGFFGVVGNLDGAYTGTYDSSVTSLSNITLNNLTVASTTSQTLIGLAAGYVDGEMSGVKVNGTATIDVNGQTSTAISSITNNLSDYGLVGYTKNAGGTPSYFQKLSEYYSNSETGSGTEDDWGGSINTKAYNEWIYDHYKDRDANGIEISNMIENFDANNVYSTDYFNLTFTTASKTKLYTSGSDTRRKQYITYANPNSFDEPTSNENKYYQTIGGQIKQTIYQLKDNSYVPLRFTDDTKTVTHMKNTGYIVGCDNPSNYILGSPKLSSGFTVNIQNSLSNTVVSTTANAAAYGKSENINYVNSNLELLTYSMENSNWYRIKDSYNGSHTTTNSRIKNFSTKTVAELGFEKYNDSRDSLKTVLESARRIQGIHFEYVEVSDTNLMQVPNKIRVNGIEYNSTYDLPKGSIDFSLKKTGFINFFAGTYYLSSTPVYNFSFFTLNHVFRSNGRITQIKKISEIYQNKYWNNGAISGSATNPKFFYKYSDGTFSNIVVNNVTRTATIADRDTTKGNDGMVFNPAAILEGVVGRNGTILQSEINNVMFYFEIPVNDGEYAMGMPPSPTGITSHTGAYMVYLDIGANGDTVDSDSVTAYSITTSRNGFYFPAGVDFAPVEVSGDGGDSIGLSIASSKKGILTFVVTNQNINITDASSIGKYAFRGNKYDSAPSSGEFNVTGNPPTAPPESTTAGGTRVLTIHLEKKDSGLEYDIRITDYLTSVGGSYVEANSIYELDSGSGYVTSSKAAIKALSEEFDSDEELESLRTTSNAATLTRESKTNNEFLTTYDIDNCSYNNKTIDVDVDLNGTTISVSVATGYKLYISGVQYANGSTYPAAP